MSSLMAPGDHDCVADEARARKEIDQRLTAAGWVVQSQDREVAYNPLLLPETFDVIIIDECHRPIYGQINRNLRVLRRAVARHLSQLRGDADTVYRPRPGL
jgi:type I site-specific restriction endonuclease